MKFFLLLQEKIDSPFLNLYKLRFNLAVDLAIKLKQKYNKQ